MIFPPFCGRRITDHLLGALKLNQWLMTADVRKLNVGLVNSSSGTVIVLVYLHINMISPNSQIFQMYVQ